MADIKPELLVALSRLERLYSALDKVGSAIFPDKASELYIKLLVDQILIDQEYIDQFALQRPELNTLEAVNKVVMEILKTTDEHFRFFTDISMYDEFNDIVRKYTEEAIVKERSSDGPRLYTLFDAGSAEQNARLSQIQESKRNGLHLSWYPDGSVKEIGLYHNDEPVGLWATYHEDGKLENRITHSLSKEERHKQLVETFRSNMIVFDPEAEKPVESTSATEQEEVGLGSVLFGSLAALTLTALVSNKNRRKATSVKAGSSAVVPKAQEQKAIAPAPVYAKAN